MSIARQVSPLEWPEHAACQPATFNPVVARLGFPRTMYRDDCARAVACARCGVLLPDPATSYAGGVVLAWCDRCSG